MKLRSIIIALVILVLCSTVWAAPAFVASTTFGGPGNVTSSAINTTGANFIVMSVSEFNGAPTAISDSKGNTWTPLTNQVNSTTNARLFYTIPTSVGSGHTFTISDGAVFPGVTVAAFSGIKQTSPFDVQNGAVFSASGQTGSITPSINGELLISGFGYIQSLSPTIDSGFTQITCINFSTGVNLGSCMGYLIQSTAAAINPTWTAAAGNNAATIASFKPLTATHCNSCDMSGY